MSYLPTVGRGSFPSPSYIGIMQRSWCPLPASPTLDYAVYGTRSSWGNLSLHAPKVLHIRKLPGCFKSLKVSVIFREHILPYFCESPQAVNMSQGYRQTQLDYELPSTIESIKNGWQTTCQSGVIVSGLLAVTAAQLLTFFKNTSNFNNVSTPGARTFLILLCYGSLFFNTSASISSFVLIDRLGELQFRAAQKDQSILPSGGFMSVGADNLLIRFGAGRLWTCIAWHWVFSYLAGIWCMILQVLTYIWLQESAPIRITMTSLAGFSILPLVAFLAPLFRASSATR